MNSRNIAAVTIVGLLWMVSPLAHAQDGGVMGEVVDSSKQAVLTGSGDCLRTKSADRSAGSCLSDAAAVQQPERIPAAAPSQPEQPEVRTAATEAPPVPVIPKRPPVAQAAVPVKTPKRIKLVSLQKAEILFPFGKSQLSSSGKEVISGIAKDIKKESANYPPTYVIYIRAFTDRMGSERSNLKLSKARARAVEREMEKYGLPREKFSVEGVGSKQSIVGDKCDHMKPHTSANKALISCMQPDRRAEIEVQDSPSAGFRSEGAAPSDRVIHRKVMRPKKN